MTTTCTTCFALVPAESAALHQQWHEAQTDLLLRLLRAADPGEP